MLNNSCALLLPLASNTTLQELFRSSHYCITHINYIINTVVTGFLTRNEFPVYDKKLKCYYKLL